MGEKRQSRTVKNYFALDEDDIGEVNSILPLDESGDEIQTYEGYEQAGSMEYQEHYGEDDGWNGPLRLHKLCFTKTQVVEILKKREQQGQEWKFIEMVGNGSFATTYSVDIIRMGIKASYVLKIMDLTWLAEKASVGYMDTVKLVKIREKAEKRFLDRAKKEAAFLKAFHDVPQIVNLDESWEDIVVDEDKVEHQIYCFLLERWEGDISDPIKLKRTQSIGLQLGVDLMSALYEMNVKPQDGSYVIHRDLRCENVLYRPARNACGYQFALSDFGIAKSASESNERMNSIAPNVWEILPDMGQQYTWKSDVYLAGITIYCFMAGWSSEKMRSISVNPNFQFFDKMGGVTLECPHSIKNARFWDLLKQMMHRDADKRPKLKDALNTLKKLIIEDSEKRKKKSTVATATGIIAVFVGTFFICILFDGKLTESIMLPKETNPAMENTRIEQSLPDGVANETRVTDGEEVENIMGESDDVWKDIEVSMIVGNYDGALKKAEKYGLMETDEILNLQGVIYANGLGRNTDLERAIRYFEAACIRSGSAVSFRNLLLAALSADLAEMAEGASAQMPHTADAFRFGERKKIPEADRILVDRVYVTEGVILEERENIYDYFWSLNNWTEILKDGVLELTPYRYLVASNYDYIITEYENGEKDVQAIAVQIIEKEIPIRVMRGSYPDAYVTFYSDTLERTSSNAIDIAVYDYPTTYIDADGNEQYWQDTDDIYHGEIPPPDTDDSRWMINGFDENGIREFKKQIKNDMQRV